MVCPLALWIVCPCALWMVCPFALWIVFALAPWLVFREGTQESGFRWRRLPRFVGCFSAVLTLANGVSANAPGTTTGACASACGSTRVTADVSGDASGEVSAPTVSSGGGQGRTTPTGGEVRCKP